MSWLQVPRDKRVIFNKSQNKFQDPAKLRRLVVDLIGKEQWVSMATLKNEGVIKFEGLKIIEYKLPKAKKVKTVPA